MATEQRPSRPAVLPVVLLAIAGVTGVGIWQAVSGTDSVAPERPQSSTATPGLAAPSVDVVVDLAAGGAHPSSAASPAPSSSPSATDDGGWDESGDFMPGAAPSYEPAGEREVQDGDDAVAKAALEAVVPLWASIDLAKSLSPAEWTATFSGLDHVSSQFVARSTDRFADLFSGALQADMSTRNAKVTATHPLWNLGAESLWRVTVTRDVVSNQGIDAMNTTETVTWDFRVDQTGDTFALVDFSAPSKSNESPATYVPERLR